MMNNDKTPVSDFLNGLTQKIRETEQKIGKPKPKKQNWDSARESTKPKSFSEFDVESSLKKAEQRLGEFSVFASNKINDAVTRLNNHANDNNPVTDSEEKNVATNSSSSYSENNQNDDDPLVHVKLEEGAEGFTFQRFIDKRKESDQIKEEVEELMKNDSTKSNRKDNVFDIFSMTEGRTDEKESVKPNKTKTEEYVSNIQNLWNTKVLNDKNLERVDHVVDSINDKVNSIYKKSNDWLNTSDSQGKVEDQGGFDFYKVESKPFWVNGNTVSSGVELLNTIETNSGDDTTSFGVILDKGNEHNVLVFALLAARNKEYNSLHLDLTNIQDNDLGKQKIKKAFAEVKDFVKNDLQDGLITIDVRGAEASVIEPLLSRVHYASGIPGSFSVNKWTVLVLADSLDNIVNKDELFSKEYSSSVVVEY